MNVFDLSVNFVDIGASRFSCVPVLMDRDCWRQIYAFTIGLKEDGVLKMIESWSSSLKSFVFKIISKFNYCALVD